MIKVNKYIANYSGNPDPIVYGFQWDGHNVYQNVPACYLSYFSLASHFGKRGLAIKGKAGGSYAQPGDMIFLTHLGFNSMGLLRFKRHWELVKKGDLNHLINYQKPKKLLEWLLMTQYKNHNNLVYGFRWNGSNLDQNIAESDRAFFIRHLDGLEIRNAMGVFMAEKGDEIIKCSFGFFAVPYDYFKAEWQKVTRHHG